MPHAEEYRAQFRLMSVPPEERLPLDPQAAVDVEYTKILGALFDLQQFLPLGLSTSPLPAVLQTLMGALCNVLYRLNRALSIAQQPAAVMLEVRKETERSVNFLGELMRFPYSGSRPHVYRGPLKKLYFQLEETRLTLARHLAEKRGLRLLEPVDDDAPRQ